MAAYSQPSNLHPNKRRYEEIVVYNAHNHDDDRSSKRRLRTNFSEEQSNLLEEAFQESHYPDQNTKRNMAISLDIPEDRITVWFQNRRAKWRRKEMREKERTKCDLPVLDFSQSQLSQFPQEYPEPMFVDYQQPFTMDIPQPQPLPSCNQIAFQNPNHQQYHMHYPSGQ